jgi:hypothetical protein
VLFQLQFVPISVANSSKQTTFVFLTVSAKALPVTNEQAHKQAHKTKGSVNFFIIFSPLEKVRQVPDAAQTSTAMAHEKRGSAQNWGQGSTGALTFHLLVKSITKSAGRSSDFRLKASTFSISLLLLGNQWSTKH